MGVSLGGRVAQNAGKLAKRISELAKRSLEKG